MELVALPVLNAEDAVQEVVPECVTPERLNSPPRTPVAHGLDQTPTDVRERHRVLMERSAVAPASGPGSGRGRKLGCRNRTPEEKAAEEAAAALMRRKSVKKMASRSRRQLEFAKLRGDITLRTQRARVLLAQANALADALRVAEEEALALTDDDASFQTAEEIAKATITERLLSEEQSALTAGSSQSQLDA